MNTLAKVLTELMLSVPIAAMNLHLLVKEMGREGVAGQYIWPVKAMAGQNIWPVKAMVIWTASVYLLTRIHHPPHKLRAHHSLGDYAR